MNYAETSRDAWRAFIPVSATLDHAIMTALTHAGEEGLTCQEIEQTTERSHQSVSANLRHLVEKGIAKASGAFGRTASGRRANKWVVA